MFADLYGKENNTRDLTFTHYTHSGCNGEVRNSGFRNIDLSLSPQEITRHTLAHLNSRLVKRINIQQSSS
mgnify:CR=1 FL=1